jgi:hypothetical protein
MTNPSSPRELETLLRERLAVMREEHERFGASFPFEKRYVSITVAEAQSILESLSPPIESGWRDIGCKVELLGEKLFALSDKLREAGIFTGKSTPLTEAYEAVVLAMSAVHDALEALPPPPGSFIPGKGLEEAVKIVHEQRAAFIDPAYAGGPMGAFGEIFACDEIIKALEAALQSPSDTLKDRGDPSGNGARHD